MKFEHTQVFGFEAALRGMRNPYDSWMNSDTLVDPKDNRTIEHVVIGPKDLKLAQDLITGGDPHFKFLRQIQVWADITAPLYWWTEADTYKVGTTRDSCSTMHMLGKKPLDQSMFEDRYLDAVELTRLIAELNSIQEEYTHCKENKDNNGMQTCHKKMKALLPSSYLLKSTWSGNYAVLRNMYHWRKDHRLSEWNEDFVTWIKSLPYSEELIIYKN